MSERVEIVQCELAEKSEGSFLDVLRVSTRLGFTSFGGPIAHLGYFHEEYVKRRKWIDEQSYADLVALCQFLPGPASSQVSIAIGIARARLPGGIAAWIGFTLPSAVALTAFAFGIGAFADTTDTGWLHGLKVVAVAVVVQAVWGMARSLCPDRERATIAIFASIVVLAWPSAIGQLSSIAIAGLVGSRIFSGTAASSVSTMRFPIGKKLAIAAWFVFFTLLISLPLVRRIYAGHALEVFDSFFRVGSLVFGGGHVVLPLLQAEVVGRGWVTNEQFVAGYGATQAVPGPLFTFAAYLGAVMIPEPNGWTGAFLALLAIFLPSFLLVIGAIPFWDLLRTTPIFQSALKGINAAVVGLLLAALYNPVWTSAIYSPADFALGLVAFGLLMFWQFPPWLVVLLMAIGGEVISRI
jgi:chromate transporter